MQNEEYQQNTSILTYADAHGIQSNYSLDSLAGLMNRYTDWCIIEGNKFIQRRRKRFHRIKYDYNDITERERMVNGELSENNNRLKKLKSKSNDVKNILQEKGNKSGFWRYIFSNRSFWILNVIILFLMGLWSLLLLLMRANKIDITDMIGGAIEHFGSYSQGIPPFDLLILFGFGLFWASAFGITYLLLYYRYYIRKPERKWKLYEYSGFTLLILFELLFTVYAIHQSYLLSEQYKYMAEAQLSTTLLSATPFILAWFAIHFFYKVWVLNIRDDATEYTGEIFKREKREELKELADDINRVNSELLSLNNEIDNIDNGRSKLKDDIKSFIDTDYEVNGIFNTTLDNIEQICTDWWKKLEAWLILSGNNNNNDDHKLILKGIKENADEKLKKENDALKKEHITMINDAEKFLNKIRNGTKFDTDRYSSSAPLVRVSVIVLIALGVAGCGGESKFFAEKQINAEFDNLLVIPDLSDRYLQDEHGLFLPVEYDLGVITQLYQNYSDRIMQMYDAGLSVTEVRGNFCIIPAPVPHDTRWDLMAMGSCWELSDLPLRQRWNYLDIQRDSVLNFTKRLYEAGLKHTPKGVDYWQFFANQLPLYLKRSDSLKTWNNRIILLTDAYLYMDSHLKNQRRSVGMKRDYLEESDINLLRRSSDWENTFRENDMGFLPVGNDFSNFNISVLVVGLNPPKTFRGSAVEWQIIQKFWSDWFNSMGIDNYQFVPLHSPATSRVVQNFLNEQ